MPRRKTLQVWADDVFAGVISRSFQDQVPMTLRHKAFRLPTKFITTSDILHLTPDGVFRDSDGKMVVRANGK